MSAPLLLGLLALGICAGLAAGIVLHRHRPGRILDAIQGGVGAVLCLEVFALTGPLDGGPGELAVLAVLGAWVAVGASHAAAALTRRAGLTGGPDDH